VGNFSGGSAYAMAKDIAEGYLLVTERTYLRLLPPELDQLAFEMDRAMRDIRSDQPALEDIMALKQRNRKLQRLTGALSILRSVQARRRPGGARMPKG
jgi:hypothetical protein